jgi:hypothetical protein
MKKKYNLLMTGLSSLMICLAFVSEAQILYTQNTPAVGDVIVKEDLDFGGGAISQAADDFEVPGGQTWTITQIDLPGRYQYPDANGDGFTTGRVGGVNLTIYTNDGGRPGDVVYNNMILIPETQLDPNLEVVIPGGLTLQPGIYWIGIYTAVCCYSNDQSWYWKTTATVEHHTALFKSTLPTAPDVINWTPVYEVFPQSPVDMLFTLHGTAEGVAAPLAPDNLAVSILDSVSSVLTWADNSSDETGFVIERSTDGMSFTILANVGAGVTSYTDIDNFNPALRYYYRVAATGSAGNSVYSDVAFADRLQIVYEQAGNPSEYGASSQRWRDKSDNGIGNPETYEKVRSADDILIPANETWTLKKVVVPSVAFYPAWAMLENATVEIFSDGSPYEIPTPDSTLTISSQPGTTIFKTTILIPYANRFNSTLELVLPEPVDLVSGHYWISVYPTTEKDSYWYWATTYDVHHVVAQENDVRSNPSTSMQWKPVYIAEGIGIPVDLMFTLMGAVTSTFVDSLPAPVAKPALHVTTNHFTANWTAVEGANYYELDVISIKDSTFLPGYESKVVYGTTQLVSGTNPSKRYMYVVRAVNESAVSENSNTIIVAPNKGLTLRTVCSDSPAEYRRWKIINNNPFNVEFKWRVPNTSQSGMLSAAPGETFFTTQTVPGINYLRITWYDDNGHQFSSLKSSTWKSCEEVLARGGNVNEAVEEEIAFMIDSWPNPVENKFNIAITAPVDSEVHVDIINVHGQSMFSTKGKGSTVLEVDCDTYSPGLYIIKASHGNDQSVRKLLKK